MDNQNPYGAGGGGGYGPVGGAPPGGGGFGPPPGGGGGYPGGGGVTPGNLDVGDVLSTTFRTIGAALVPILGCALAVVVPTSVLNFGVSIGAYFISQEALRSTGPEAMTAMLLIIPLTFGVALVGIALQAVGQGGIVYAVAEQLSGRSPSLGQAFRVGLSRAFWMFLTNLILFFAIIIGTFMCIAPGVIAGVFFAVAAPVCIVEKLGPIDSLTRSVQLTEGNRMNIFLIGLAVFVGWMVIAFCILMPVQMLVLGGSAAVSGGGPAGIQAMQDPLSIGQILTQIVNIPVTLFATMAGSTLVAVIYARLRGLRDGVDAQAIASVFT